MRSLRAKETQNGTSLWVTFFSVAEDTWTLKDISILLALWTPTTTNTARRRQVCVIAEMLMAEDIRPRRQAVARAVTSVPHYFAPIAAASVWAETLSVVADVTEVLL